MKVGEIGFVIKLKDGTFEGRRAGRSGPERPFTSYRDAENIRIGRRYSWQQPKPDPRFDGAKVVPVRLVEMEIL